MEICYMVKWHIKMVAFQNTGERVDCSLNGEL